MPLISVIIPVYKVEKYLNRCVDSVLNQTFRDLEVILVDDGSPDRCPQICDAYAKKDSRVRVIHKENGGLSDARNAGIDIATGQFLAFVDSDDWLRNDIYEYAMNLQRKYQADIVEFGIKRVLNELEATEEENNVPTDTYICTGIQMLPRIYQDNLGGSIVVWNKLYAKSVFWSLRFEKGRINEDTLLLPKLFYQAKKCVATSYIGYYYYQGNEGSITHSSFSRKNFDALYAHNNNRTFYIEHNLKEAQLWCDTTYAFVLANMMKKTKKHLGKKSKEYQSIKREYCNKLGEFLDNPYFLWKQKVLLVLHFLFE